MKLLHILLFIGLTSLVAAFLQRIGDFEWLRRRLDSLVRGEFGRPVHGQPPVPSGLATDEATGFGTPAAKAAYTAGQDPGGRMHDPSSDGPSGGDAGSRPATGAQGAQQGYPQAVPTLPDAEFPTADRLLAESLLEYAHAHPEDAVPAAEAAHVERIVPLVQAVMPEVTSTGAGNGKPQAASRGLGADTPVAHTSAVDSFVPEPGHASDTDADAEAKRLQAEEGTPLSSDEAALGSRGGEMPLQEGTPAPGSAGIITDVVDLDTEEGDRVADVQMPSGSAQGRRDDQSRGPPDRPGSKVRSQSDRDVHRSLEGQIPAQQSKDQVQEEGGTNLLIMTA